MCDKAQVSGRGWGEETNGDDEPAVWCVLEKRADEQLLEAEYENLGYRFHEFLEPTSDVSEPQFQRLDRKRLRFSDGRSICILVRKRMG
jgi:hypothetical protein